MLHGADQNTPTEALRVSKHPGGNFDGCGAPSGRRDRLGACIDVCTGHPLVIESGQGEGSTLQGILGKGTGRFRRCLVLGSLLVAVVASFKPVQTSGALLEMYSSSFRRCLVPLRTSLYVESRRFFSSAEFRTGRYAKVTEDVPIKEFESLRKVINKRRITDLMEEISSGQKQPNIINIVSDRCLPALVTFVGDLALHYHQLLHPIPAAERNTHLDVVCETKDEVIDIEVQVEPQNFWDIRILSHVCGLFQR
jgi:hypothetical protein